MTCPVCAKASRDGLPCWDCVRCARRDLAEIPWLYLDTRRAALGLVRLGDRNGGRSATTPLPVNLQASALADRVRAGIVGWVRIAVERGADWPTGRVSDMAPLLADRMHDLRHHEAAAELMADVSRWTADMVRTINRPAVRRIEVGPCPLDVTDADGTLTPCTGTVWAIFPTSGADDAPPVHAACSWCCDPDADPAPGLWVAEQWRTLGRLIAKRKADDEARRRLLASIIGGKAIG